MSDPIDFKDIPPKHPGRKLDEVHIWIGMHTDGSETMLSSDLDVGAADGIPRHLPLMNSDFTVADKLAPLARRIQLMTRNLYGIELRTYRRVP